MRPIRTLDQGADVNEVFLDDVVVPVENLVGEENRGWTIAKYLLGHERTNIAGIGMCKRLLRRVKELAAQQTRRGRPLIEDARFREKLAHLEIQVLSHEWSLMRMISLEQAGREISTEASMLKIRGSEIQQDLGELLMQCAGEYALPYSPEWLEEGQGSEAPRRRRACRARGAVFRSAQGRDLRRHQRSAEEPHRPRGDRALAVDFNYTDEQTMLADSLGRWLESRLRLCTPSASGRRRGILA